MLADLVVDLLVALVDNGTDARRLQRLDHLIGIGIGIRHDGRDHRRLRGEPERETAGMVFDQDAEKALERAEDRAVEHDRALLRSVFGDIRRSEEHTSELQSLMRISYAVFCLIKQNTYYIL